ncbi:MAG: bifunctional adenosylcobinamide kinase/adenosylcobinamide-phosphate guanylyltransferase [Chromatiales bacterium]|nr:bifunctional adenosylcobinamide kinase/adenosylcobinamide-phosphate guanylyltransferase [Chromatiales bacterium]
MRELILGGARSGKSRLAEERAESSGLEVIYIATAAPRDSAIDPEMAERIRHHQQQRPSHWQTIEEPIRLAERLSESAAKGRTLLVDCLTLWLSNLLGGDEIDEALFEHERSALLRVLPELSGEIILVSNEVGQGIVPMGKLTRKFCDESGRLHQDIAKICDQVTFVTAGLPMKLK